MATIVGHLGHNASTDVVGLSWVVSYVGIGRVDTRQLAVPSHRGEEEHPRQHWSCRLGSLHAE
jgi:hypothetical protein